MVPSYIDSSKSNKTFWDYKNNISNSTKGYQRTLTAWIGTNWRKALWRERLFVRVKILH